jgi:hypothetical protein
MWCLDRGTACFLETSDYINELIASPVLYNLIGVVESFVIEVVLPV